LKIRSKERPTFILEISIVQPLDKQLPFFAKIRQQACLTTYSLIWKTMTLPILGSNIAKSSQHLNPEGNDTAKIMKRATDKNQLILEGVAIFISFR